MARAIVSFTDLRVDARDNGLGYAITFSASAVLPVTSMHFHVVEGSGTRLVVVVQPEGFRSGYPLKVQPRIALHDVGGNVIALNISVAVELKFVVAALGEPTLQLTGTHREFTESWLAVQHELEPAASLSGAAFAAARGSDGGTGVAQFTDLGLKSYTSSTASGLMLQFTASCQSATDCPYLGVRSREFTSGGAPTALALLTSPLAPSVAGSVMPVQPKVILQDLSRITVEFWDSVGKNYALATAALVVNGGADARDAVLLGNTSAIYRNGVAEWTDLRIDVASEAPATPFSPAPAGYFLSFRLRGREWTQGGLLVSHAAPYAYHIWVEPGSGVAAQALLPGPYMSPAVRQGGGPVVALVDEFGNRAESISEGLVTAALVNLSAIALSDHPGPFESIGILQVGLQRGIANFSQAGLGSLVAASGLIFNFSGHGVAPVPGVTEGWAFGSRAAAALPTPALSYLTTKFVLSQIFTVSPGEVIALRAHREPAVFVASNAIAPQPIIHLIDAGSNAVAEASWQTIKMSLVASDGSVTLLGSAQASRGVARFENVGAGSAMAGARLQYRCDPCRHGGASIAIQSEAFDVAAFSGGKTVKIERQPSLTSYGGTVFDEQPVVAILDGQGHLVTADDSTVVRATLVSLKEKETLWDLPRDVLLGTTEATAVRGLASFTDLRVTWCNDAESRTCTRHSKVRIRFATERFSPACAPFPERYPPIAPPCQPADSPLLTVSVGAPAKLTIIQQPRGAKPAGSALDTAPIVAVADAGGNIIDRQPASLRETVIH